MTSSTIPTGEVGAPLRWLIAAMAHLPIPEAPLCAHVDAGYASCPVTVVRPEQPADGAANAVAAETLAVGAPGGDSAAAFEAVLEYGFAYADRHGLPLVALHVYTLGAFVYPVMPYPVPYPIEEDLARIRAEAARAVEHSLGTLTEKYPEVEVRSDVAEGGAAEKLVEASRTASLLVVGTRGHGGLAAMLLGSVSHAVLRHAHSPVVVACCTTRCGYW